MNVFGTQMHWLTLVLTLLETLFFFIQMNDILRYPLRRWQWWDLWLLLLLIGFNLANGFLPDTSLNLDIRLQYMIAYGAAYLVGSYFPFYFYKMYRLKSLRLWATWGVAVFVFLPYLICDVLLYAINGKLIADREWGVIVPALYGITVLYIMAWAIVKKYRAHGNHMQFRCELIVWTCLLPWEIMSLVAFYPQPQWLRILAANLGWVAIALIKLAQLALLVRRDDLTLRQLNFDDIDPKVLEANSRKGGMSNRQTEIVLLLREHKTSSEIADLLFVSDWTVKSHIKNMLRKAGVNSRGALVRKFGDPER